MAWFAAMFLLIASGWPRPARVAAEDLAAELKRVPFQIVFETFRDGNWELFRVNADGSRPTNLTRTPKINEMYPHVSPDGSKVSFVVDEEEAGRKVRNVYVMNLDGSGRRLVARNAREPFWNPAGTAVIYVKGESDKFSILDYVTRGIFTFDLAAGRETEHPNHAIHHLYNPSITPDGKWYVSTVHAGMGYGHAILALESDGNRVVNLKLPGCRPDVSPDGRKVAWGADDFTIRVGDLDFTGPEPKVIHPRDVVKSRKPMETYHVDWSPDGKYLAFSRGPTHKHLGPAPEMVGVEAEGWNICVADAAATNRWVAITTDGQSNKEPDWMPARKEKP